MAIYLVLSAEEAVKLQILLKESSNKSLSDFAKELSRDIDTKMKTQKKIDTRDNGLMSYKELCELFTEDTLWKWIKNEKDGCTKDLLKAEIKDIGVKTFLDAFLEQNDGSFLFEHYHPAKRTLEFIALRHGKGMSYEDIGSRYGLKKERVRQVVTSYSNINKAERLASKIRRKNNDEYKFKGSETPISELDFPIRIRNCLTRAGIHTVGDLLGKTEDELFRIRNMGKKSFKEIEAWLDENELSLKQE